MARTRRGLHGTPVRLNADGQASFTRVFSRRGRFTIRAVYSGDATFDASSQSLTEQVNR